MRVFVRLSIMSFCRCNGQFAVIAHHQQPSNRLLIAQAAAGGPAQQRKRAKLDINTHIYYHPPGFRSNNRLFTTAT